VFMIARAARQTFAPPYPFGGVLMMAGYLKGYWQRDRRIAAPELVKFIRRQQMRRLLMMESLWR
jgi:poly-beta-1,6-N-acetyl-D-glucosamine synthase